MHVWWARLDTVRTPVWKSCDSSLRGDRRAVSRATAAALGVTGRRYAIGGRRPAPSVQAAVSWGEDVCQVGCVGVGESEDLVAGPQDRVGVDRQ